MEPARHTSALFISGFCLTAMRLLRRFRRAGSSGGEWPLPPEGTAPSGCWATTQRGYHCCRSGCQDMLRRHVVAPGVLSLCMHFSTSFLVNTSGRARGCCCGGVLRGQRGHRCCRSYWCSQAFKTHATISPFRPLFWLFLLLSISLLCCLFCIVSQATKILFFRSASRWSIGDEQGHRFLLFLQVGRRLLRLGCCAGRPSPSKVSCWVARKTHATFSLSLRCVLFVIEAVCSVACSVVDSLHDVLKFFLAEFPVLLASRCSSARQ